MPYTHYEDYTSGVTLYAKANPLNTDTWATGIISGSENGSSGSYAFASVDEDTRYTIYEQSGGSPASSDTAVGYIPYLATDLIAAAVASQSSIAALIAAWADGGRLDVILDAIKAVTDTLSSTGAGAHSIELTIRLADNSLVPECDCILTTSNTNANTDVYASAPSNANGVVDFDVDQGTYYLWRQKAGVNFTNPKTVTVDSDGVATVS